MYVLLLAFGVLSTFRELIPCRCLMVSSPQADCEAHLT
jgi:hypothetical protein